MVTTSKPSSFFYVRINSPGSSLMNLRKNTFPISIKINDAILNNQISTMFIPDKSLNRTAIRLQAVHVVAMERIKPKLGRTDDDDNDDVVNILQKYVGDRTENIASSVTKTSCNQTNPCISFAHPAESDDTKISSSSFVVVIFIMKNKLKIV